MAAVMVTSPADERLIVDPVSPSQVVRAALQVRARVWGDRIRSVTFSVDAGEAVAMAELGVCLWGAEWNAAGAADGAHELTVTATDGNGQTVSDRIVVSVNRGGEYSMPARQEIDYENVIGAWPEKHILGTQLGPNENGHPWPGRQEVTRAR